MPSPYRQYSDFLATLFPGVKVQKISVATVSTCPNRDGTLSTGGCTYCLNASFSPEYARASAPVTSQLEEGKRFFARKYPQMKYLAYFQTYTSTYGDASRLATSLHEALSVPDVLGAVVGTRPDAIDAPRLALMRDAALSHGARLIIELGAESSHDRTLERVNRCHTWTDTVRAVNLCADAGIPVGLHLIMGLPGETEEDMLVTVDRLNELPVDTVKFHQLQILRGTAIAAQWERGEFDLTFTTPEMYAAFCRKVIGRLRPGIAIDRFLAQAPPDLVLAPRWGLKNYQFAALLR